MSADTHMHESPVELTKGFTFKAQDEVPKYFKRNRISTLPVRGESSTDYSGPWTPQYVLSLGMMISHVLLTTSEADLCLDGGGIKGYSSLWILKRLMDHIDEEEKSLGPDPPQPWYTEDQPQRQPPFQPCDYFDYVFGTSTGGLIAIMLGRLRMSVDDALDAYKRLAGKVFAKPRWLSFFGLFRDMYDHHELKVAIDEVVEGRNDYAKLPQKSERPGSSAASAMSEPEDDEVEEIESSQPDEPRRDGMQRSFGGVLNAGPTFNSDPTMCRTYVAESLMFAID